MASFLHERLAWHVMDAFVVAVSSLGNAYGDLKAVTPGPTLQTVKGNAVADMALVWTDDFHVTEQIMVCEVAVSQSMKDATEKFNSRWNKAPTVQSGFVVCVDEGMRSVNLGGDEELTGIVRDLVRARDDRRESPKDAIAKEIGRLRADAEPLSAVKLKSFTIVGELSISWKFFKRTEEGDKLEPFSLRADRPATILVCASLFFARQSLKRFTESPETTRASHHGRFERVPRGSLDRGTAFTTRAE